MASERLDVILSLITGNYKREAREAATATGQIAGKAKEAGGAVGGMASRMSAAGAAIRVGFAAVAGSALLKVIGNLDELGTQMQATERRADVVFGEMADDAREWADRQNEAFGIGENALLGLAAATQDLLVPMGFARDEAFGMTTDILTTANALSEWTGGTIGAADAQRILTKAILGERDGLVELGIKISEADVQARLAATGQDKLTGAALAQAKTQATLALVTERSADALHAYNGRAGTAIALQKELDASTADTAETWAEIFKPAIDEAKKAVKDLADIAGFLTRKTGEQTDATGGLVDAWKTTQPVGALLLFLLEELGEAARNANDDTVPLVGTAHALRGAARDAASPLGIVANKLGLVATNAAEGTTNLVNLSDQMRAMIDPAFAALNALGRYQQAQANLNAVLDEFEPTSQEAAAAGQEVVESYQDLVDAADLYSQVSGQDLITSLLTLGREAGVPLEVINAIIAGLDQLDGLVVRPTIEYLIKTIGTPPAKIGSGAGGYYPYQHGGAYPAFRPMLVGEAGPEMLIPNTGGTVLSNPDTKRWLAAMMGGSGAGWNVTINTNTVETGTIDLLGTLAGVQRRVEARR